MDPLRSSVLLLVGKQKPLPQLAISATMLALAVIAMVLVLAPVVSRTREAAFHED